MGLLIVPTSNIQTVTLKLINTEGARPSNCGNTLKFTSKIYTEIGTKGSAKFQNTPSNAPRYVFLKSAANMVPICDRNRTTSAVILAIARIEFVCARDEGS